MTKDTIIPAAAGFYEVGIWWDDNRWRQDRMPIVAWSIDEDMIPCPVSRRTDAIYTHTAILSPDGRYHWDCSVYDHWDALCNALGVEHCFRPAA